MKLAKGLMVSSAPHTKQQPNVDRFDRWTDKQYKGETKILIYRDH